MKKHIFFVGGGGGQTSAQYLKVMSIILDFIKKKSEEDWTKQVVR